MNIATAIEPTASEPVPGLQPLAASLTGVARHVCVDGCQFVITGLSPSVRQRLSFSLASGTVITGSVSWILGDRIAFAFDRQITSTAMSALASHQSSLTAVTLSPC